MADGRWENAEDWAYNDDSYLDLMRDLAGAIAALERVEYGREMTITSSSDTYWIKSEDGAVDGRVERVRAKANSHWERPGKISVHISYNPREALPRSSPDPSQDPDRDWHQEYSDLIDTVDRHLERF